MTPLQHHALEQVIKLVGAADKVLTFGYTTEKACSAFLLYKMEEAMKELRTAQDVLSALKQEK